MAGDARTGSFSFLDALPNQTFLFYLWEPHYNIQRGTDIARVKFEDPVMCDVNETFTKLPEKHACDFREGQVHKGYSNRIASTSSPYVDVSVRALMRPVACSESATIPSNSILLSLSLFLRADRPPH